MVKTTPCSKCKKLISNNYLKRHEATCKGDNVEIDDENELSKMINKITDNIDNEPEPEVPEVPENVESTEVETKDDSLGIIGAFVMMVIVVLGVLYYFTKTKEDDPDE